MVFLTKLISQGARSRMSKEQPKEQGFKVAGLPSSQPNVFDSRVKRMERLFWTGSAAFVLAVGGVIFGAVRYDESRAQTKVQKVLEPKILDVERDAKITTADVNELSGMSDELTSNGHNKLSPRALALGHHLALNLQADFAKDQDDYEAFSLTVAREEGKPYSEGILSEDQGKVLGVLSHIPGAGANLQLGSG
jgi:hypothetical protein